MDLKQLMRKRAILVMAAMSLLACDIVVEPVVLPAGGGAPTSTSNSGGHGGMGGHGGGDSAPYPTVSDCTVSPAQTVPFMTEAAFTAALIGRWELCGTVTPFGAIGGVGLEIVDDGSWYFLEDSGGQLVRATTIDKQGSWTIAFTTPDYSQVNLHPHTGGSYGMTTIMHDNPHMMYMTNTGILEGWYHFLPEE